MKRITFLRTLLAVPAALLGLKAFAKKDKSEVWTMVRDRNSVRLFKNGKSVKAEKPPSIMVLYGQSNWCAFPAAFRHNL